MKIIKGVDFSYFKDILTLEEIIKSSFDVALKNRSAY